MKRLLLAGAGHAHAFVLESLIRQPMPGVDVVLVSPEPLAPYSGMVPGWLSGHYRFDEIVIDFRSLVAAAGARWVQGELHGLDPAQRLVRLVGGSSMGYDVLSLNVGSTLYPPWHGHAQLLPLRPLSLLRERYERVLERWSRDPSCSPFVVTAVGGGAAGVEALLAVLARLRALRPDRIVRGHLRTRGPTLLADLAPPARRAACRALDRAGVAVETDSAWSAQIDRHSDLVIWATGAQAQPWQRAPARRGALAVDAQGFIRIDPQLRSISHPDILAAGDCASWTERTLPKAGVHAVRMGPVLATNLRAALLGPEVGGAFIEHRPQRHALSLLSIGAGRAIASRGTLGAEGAWAWRWKDRIDRRFVSRFRTTRPDCATAAPTPLADGSSTTPGTPR